MTAAHSGEGLEDRFPGSAMPPEQLGEKIPSLSLFSLNIEVRGFSLAGAMVFPRSKISGLHEIETRIISGRR